MVDHEAINFFSLNFQDFLLSYTSPISKIFEGIGDGWKMEVVTSAPPTKSKTLLKPCSNHILYWNHAQTKLEPSSNQSKTMLKQIKNHAQTIQKPCSNHILCSNRAQTNWKPCSNHILYWNHAITNSNHILLSTKAWTMLKPSSNQSKSMLKPIKNHAQTTYHVQTML